MSSDHISSVLKAAAILGLFKREGEWSVTEIAQALYLPLTTAHRQVSTLAETGLLYQNRTTSRYRLGLEAFLLGSRVEIVRLLEETVGARIEKLAHELNESVHVSIPDGTESVAVLKAGSSHYLAAMPQVGDRRELHATAVGRCLLAFNCQNCYDAFRFMERPLAAYTGRTLVDRREIDRALQEVRAHGYSIDDEEVEEGLVCIGTPILSRRGVCIAAMSCSVPKQRYLGSEEAIREAVLRTAREISENM